MKRPSGAALARGQGAREPLAILGSGATATALARGLSRAGEPLALWSRNPAHARRLHGRFGNDRPQLLTGLDQLTDLRRLLFCVSDRAIAELAADLARRLPAGGGRVALHTSGALGCEVLGALEERGWATGSLHPLLSFPPPARGKPAAKNAEPPKLEGALFAIDGASAARREARRLARALAARPVILHAEDRVRYHAAAALLAGGLAALFEASESLLGEALSGRAARDGLLRLARSVLDNVQQGGPERALSGPAARGDDQVVADHLQAMESEEAETALLYRALVRRMLRIAVGRGTLDEGDARRLLDLIR